MEHFTHLWGLKHEAISFKMLPLLVSYCYQSEEMEIIHSTKRELNPLPSGLPQLLRIKYVKMFKELTAIHSKVLDNYSIHIVLFNFHNFSCFRDQCGEGQYTSMPYLRGKVQT